MVGSTWALAPHSPLRRPLRQHDRDAGLRRNGIWWHRRRGSRGFLWSTASVNSLFVGRQRHLDSFHHDRAGLARDSLFPPEETQETESAISLISRLHFPPNAVHNYLSFCCQKWAPTFCHVSIGVQKQQDNPKLWTEKHCYGLVDH